MALTSTSPMGPGWGAGAGSAEGEAEGRVKRERRRPEGVEGEDSDGFSVGSSDMWVVAWDCEGRSTQGGAGGLESAAGSGRGAREPASFRRKQLYAVFAILSQLQKALRQRLGAGI